MYELTKIVSNADFIVFGLKEEEEASIKGSSTPNETFEEHTEHHLSKNSEANDVIEDNVTKPSSQIEGLQHLNKRALLKKKESGIEESFDGSFISEISSEEGVLTVEHLKSVLKEERRARCALYEELEEERSANAVAAKQTMEMITRLQNEKATTQMEALQYQRMMDEQSEYDQEALQLLNELVVKVEKEKHELQMELEIHRKKVLHYEVRERRRMKRKTSELSRNLSASFSNSEDSDQLPVDFDHESIDEDSCNGHPESSINTPANGVLHLEDLDLEGSKHMTILDESLADFEAEKLSILEKLKELEEKLFTLSDEEGEYFEDVKPVALFPEDENEDSSSHDFNSNGFCKNFEGQHHKEKGNMSPDANGSHHENNGLEALDVAPNEERSITAGRQKNSSISMTVNRRLTIEEEVDNVYERLQALEADREFLKQSISSLKKGDKGMDLLQEILQYLRDLRSVELCTRKAGDHSGA
ncbi:Myosin-binding protein [Thalictrum thalictroides]|uniref:Myosin-binding protein n=1 Tax=Thalictrum thalictroides TaxID=46969 RepID=A0A7J6WRP2_THATH|nr:Myosin-binding protein [Thalictrum thalictroides]